MNVRTQLRHYTWSILVGAGTLLGALAPAGAADKKPNILVIWGDDIGTWNISHNNRGMMGYKTPNIDRVAREGVAFTDYYAQQSCTAGRAAFISGSVPVRSGMTKVGMPGAKEGWQKTDVTMATVLKSQGYATGQFGKNHQGDRDEHLPTVHGFDEFMGSRYHLNAEEEPEQRDYPRDLKLKNGKTFLQQFGPRGVLKTKADGKGGQTIENLGPLTKKRMETIDDETMAAAKDFIMRQHKAGKPFFCWWNGTRMHFRTHVKQEHIGLSGQDEYNDGMVEHDMHVGELLKLIDDLGLANATIVRLGTVAGTDFFRKHVSNERMPPFTKFLPALTPERVATAVLSAVIKKQQILTLPRYLELLTFIYNLSPRFARWLAQAGGQNRKDYARLD
jgi:arylsulfatase